MIPTFPFLWTLSVSHDDPASSPSRAAKSVHAEAFQLVSKSWFQRIWSQHMAQWFEKC